MALLTQSVHQSVPPPLKWAGGKRWLVPLLRRYWLYHQDRILVEPFVGGMSVALGLSPKSAVLNDVNKHLINFYRWVQKGLEISHTFENTREYYDSARTRFNQLIAENNYDSKEAAELFYYLNRTGFNGLCRFNRSGEFNVPFGKFKTINYMTDFSSITNVIANWEFMSQDFQEINIPSGSFIYADPPYDSTFTAYSKHPFKWAEQQRLAEWLGSLNAPVVASNQATTRVIDLYTELGFEVELLPAPRRISSTGDRTPAMEMLATLNI